MITFKQFLAESSTGAHGEYVGDVAEKTMVNAIINMLFNGEKTEQNYERVYDFIESDVFEAAYDKYYDAFKEKSEVSYEAKRDGKKRDLSPATGRALGEFKKELHELWKMWKASKVTEGTDKYDILNNKPPAKVKPEIGAKYKLSTGPLMGDFAGLEVEVETGPRGTGKTEQYRVGYGEGAYDVDWIDTWMFNDSKKLVDEAKDEKKLHSGTKNGRRAYKDYTNFKGVSADEKRELKKEMDRELKKFKDSDHKDPDSYPKIKGKTDWPADKKYREKLKKRGKKIPKSDSTLAYQRMYGDKK